MTVISRLTLISIIASSATLLGLAGCKEEKVLSVPDTAAQAKLNWAVVEQTSKSITLGSVTSEENGKKSYKERLEIKKVCISGVVYLIADNYIYTSIGDEAIYSLTPHFVRDKQTNLVQPETCETE